MFNEYLKMTEKNADIIMANSVIENLKFIVVSLDTIFKGEIGEDFYYEDYTFYFYHLQNAFTSCGNVINVFSSSLRRDRRYNERARYLQQTFDVNIRDYKWLFNKDFRNANEHYDERYDMFNGVVGDFNVISNHTPIKMKEEIMNSPHIRTLDINRWIYITYDKNGRQIECDLQQLRDEAYSLLYKISMHPRLSKNCLTHIPTKEIIK